jgi:tRNA(Ile)-lysidine synthase
MSNASIAQVRLRSALRACIEPAPFVIGCSGGPDSLALAAVAAWVAPRMGVLVTAAIIDHGLQPGSDRVAEEAAQACSALGIADVVIRRVEVTGDGGMEAAARDARRAALLEIARERESEQIVLAHTREDQAETVLLRLARGAGARSLAAMRPCAPPWHRPFLDIARADVHAVCAEVSAERSITAWQDPHNSDPAFSRVRVRAMLDDLVAQLGPGVVHGLTRSAALLADDADLLDRWASQEFRRIVEVDDLNEMVCAQRAALAELPRALRTRVLRLMHAHLAGPEVELTFDHVFTLEAYVSDWHGQGPARLPGGVGADVAYERLCLRRNPQPQE